jgi:hypothetical protein
VPAKKSAQPSPSSWASGGPASSQVSTTSAPSKQSGRQYAVRRPEATTGTPAARAAPTEVATSAVVRGRTQATGRPSSLRHTSICQPRASLLWGDDAVVAERGGEPRGQ